MSIVHNAIKVIKPWLAYNGIELKRKTRQSVSGHNVYRVAGIESRHCLRVLDAVRIVNAAAATSAARAKQGAITESLSTGPT